MDKIKNLTRGQIRYLLKMQNGRCAITGDKLDPRNVAPDHIIPISRTEFKNNPLYGKIWLVSASVNRLKLNSTMEEFFELIEKIYLNKGSAAKSLEVFNKDQDLPEMSKQEFDKYIEESFDEDGIIKD